MSLAHLLDKARELHPDLAKEWAAQEAREKAACEEIRREAARAIERLAEVIQRPNDSRLDLEEAQKHVAKALSHAASIDPEEL